MSSLRIVLALTILLFTACPAPSPPTGSDERDASPPELDRADTAPASNVVDADRSAERAALPPEQADASADATDGDAAVFAPVACDGAALGKLSRAGLARRAKSDPCAMAMLAHKIFDTATEASQLREAADLTKRAHDAGMRGVRCEVLHYGIGMEPDLRRAAGCYRRGEAWNELAVMYINGEGVRRDLDEADALATKALTPQIWGRLATCTGTQIKSLVEAERTGLSKVPFQFCKHVACSTADDGFCNWIEERVRLWKTTQSHEGVIAMLAPAERAALRRVDATLVKLAKAEAEQEYIRWIDGSCRGSEAQDREARVRKAHDRLIDTVVVARKAPTINQPDLAKLRDELTKAVAEDRVQGAKGISIHPTGPADFRKAVDKADRSWKAYRDAWLRFGPKLLSAPEPEARRAVEARLIQDRLSRLRDR